MATTTESTGPTTEERFEVEFPPELGSPEVPAPSPEGAEPESKEPEAPPEAPTPAAPRLVDQRALQEERARRKRATAERDDYRQRYEALEVERRQHYQAEQARQAEESRRRAEAEFRALNPDNAPNLASAFQQYDQITQRRIHEAREEVRRDALLSKLHLSERILRRELSEGGRDDYDEVLERSGVKDDVTLGPSGQPRDPFLHRAIFGSPDPARTAYEYALGRLSSTRTAEAEARGEQRGRAEIIERVTGAAHRPRGIASLPGSAGPQTKPGYTVKDIAKMSLEQKGWIKKHRPDIWNRYLEEGD